MNIVIDSRTYSCGSAGRLYCWVCSDNNSEFGYRIRFPGFRKLENQQWIHGWTARLAHGSWRYQDMADDLYVYIYVCRSHDNLVPLLAMGL